MFGSMPAKGQEMDDHYFGSIRPRIAAFMKDVNKELWKLGVPAKTQHNEVAPAQHEIAPIYETCNLAADHNHLVMEVLKKKAMSMACSVCSTRNRLQASTAPVSITTGR